MHSLPQAVFFDFDGVIVESADIKTKAFLELFEDFPALLPKIKDHHLNNMGISRFRKFEWIYNNLLNKPIDNIQMEELGNKFSKIVFQKVLDAPLVAGAIQLLEKISGHSLCFIASGTPEEELTRIVKSKSLSKYFREVCGTPRTKEGIINELADKYNLRRDECWFIGDAQTDYNAARQERLCFIGRYTEEMKEFWGQHSDARLVNDLSELVNYKWLR